MKKETRLAVCLSCQLISAHFSLFSLAPKSLHCPFQFLVFFHKIRKHRKSGSLSPRQADQPADPFLYSGGISLFISHWLTSWLTTPIRPGSSLAGELLLLFPDPLSHGHSFNENRSVNVLNLMQIIILQTITISPHCLWSDPTRTLLMIRSEITLPRTGMALPRPLSLRREKDTVCVILLK